MADKDRKPSASFVPFRPLDSLFEPTVQEKPEAGSISQIAIGELFPFKDHPFLPYTEERMQDICAIGSIDSTVSPGRCGIRALANSTLPLKF